MTWLGGRAGTEDGAGEPPPLRHHLPWGQMVFSMGSLEVCTPASSPLKASWPLPSSRCQPVLVPWPMMETLRMVMETGQAQWAAQPRAGNRSCLSAG